MHTINLRLRAATSRILVGAGIYKSVGDLLADADLARSGIIVTQPRIESVVRMPSIRGFERVTIPDGERAKSFRTIERVLDRMLALRLTRQSTVIAIGGGVVGDVSGFAASLFLRGIPVVQVPTTLLAQVDSSVGGKTGVNHRLGKNLIGTFHQPRLVVADPELLETLPDREYRSGLFETLKYGVIRDAALFRRFERDAVAIHERRPQVVEDLVRRSLKIKAAVVAADEKEGDLRRILNFGHTIGHAIEAVSGYRKIHHGEAVGHGMVGAARIAERIGVLDTVSAARIETAVDAIGPRPTLEGLSADAMVDAMAHDKKVRDGRVHFVLPERIGAVRMTSAVPARTLRAVVRELVGSR